MSSILLVMFANDSNVNDCPSDRHTKVNLDHFGRIVQARRHAVRRVRNCEGRHAGRGRQDRPVHSPPVDQAPHISSVSRHDGSSAREDSSRMSSSCKQHSSGVSAGMPFTLTYHILSSRVVLFCPAHDHRTSTLPATRAQLSQQFARMNCVSSTVCRRQADADPPIVHKPDWAIAKHCSLYAALSWHSLAVGLERSRADEPAPPQKPQLAAHFSAMKADCAPVHSPASETPSQPTIGRTRAIWKSPFACQSAHWGSWSTQPGDAPVAETAGILA
jgi:hypothetical protein